MKNRISKLPKYILFALLTLIIIAYVGIEIYVWVTYGGKPIDEIPAWALWFMFGGGQ